MARNGIIRQHVPAPAEIAPPIPPPPGALPPPVTPRPARPAARDTMRFGPTGGPVLGSNGYQQRAILNTSASLADLYEGKERVVVSHGHVLYWNPNNEKDKLEPDLFVVKDHVLRSESSYRIWEEGKPPNFVLEVLSPSTKKNDMSPRLKRGRYKQLKIPEYFLFEPDPTKPGPYRKKATPKNPAARLCGLRLKDGEYARIDPEPDGSIRSEELGVTVRVEGGSLRMRHAKTGRVYLWREEQPREIKRQKARAQRAEARAARLQEEKRLEARAKERAEARAARLREEKRLEARAKERAEARAARLAEEKAIESRFRISAEEEIKRLKQQLLDLQRSKRRNTYYGR